MDLNQIIESKQFLISICVITSLILLYLGKRLLLVHLHKSAQQTATDSKVFYHVLIMALNAPLNLLILGISLWLVKYSLQNLGVLSDDVAELASHGLKALIIITVILFIERCFTHAIAQYAGQSSVITNTKNIASGAIRGLLVALAVLLVLSSLGVSVTPLIASLGITSLAVALALQPTLENFFSGVQIVIDKPFRIGDFIELESGEQGFVDKIGWRSTWVKMLPNNMIVMPNSKLSQSKIINYYYPEKELSVPVDVGVHYDSDLEHVEKVCLEVANQVLEDHPWGVETYEPFVVFHTFDNSSINLTVMLRTKEYFNRFFVKSAFIKALHKRFHTEGIVIPFPITALNLNQEGVSSLTPPPAE